MVPSTPRPSSSAPLVTRAAARMPAAATDAAAAIVTRSLVARLPAAPTSRSHGQPSSCRPVAQGADHAAEAHGDGVREKKRIRASAEAAGSGSSAAAPHKLARPSRGRASAPEARTAHAGALLVPTALSRVSTPGTHAAGVGIWPAQGVRAPAPSSALPAPAPPEAAPSAARRPGAASPLVTRDPMCCGARCGCTLSSTAPVQLSPTSGQADVEPVRGAAETVQQQLARVDMVWVLCFPEQAASERLAPDCYARTNRNAMRDATLGPNAGGLCYHEVAVCGSQRILLVSSERARCADPVADAAPHADGPSSVCQDMALLRTFVAMQAAAHAGAVVYHALQQDAPTRAPQADAADGKVGGRFVPVVRQLLRCMCDMVLLHPHAGALGWMLLAAVSHPRDFQPTERMQRLCAQVALELAACSVRECLQQPADLFSSCHTDARAQGQVGWDDVARLGAPEENGRESAIVSALLVGLALEPASHEGAVLVSACRVWLQRFACHGQSSAEAHSGCTFDLLSRHWGAYLHQWALDVADAVAVITRPPLDQARLAMQCHLHTVLSPQPPATRGTPLPVGTLLERSRRASLAVADWPLCSVPLTDDDTLLQLLAAPALVEALQADASWAPACAAAAAQPVAAGMFDTPRRASDAVPRSTRGEAVAHRSPGVGADAREVLRALVRHGWNEANTRACVSPPGVWVPSSPIDSTLNRLRELVRGARLPLFVAASNRMQAVLSCTGTGASRDAPAAIDLTPLQPSATSAVSAAPAAPGTGAAAPPSPSHDAWSAPPRYAALLRECVRQAVLVGQGQRPDTERQLAGRLVQHAATHDFGPLDQRSSPSSVVPDVCSHVGEHAMHAAARVIVSGARDQSTRARGVAEQPTKARVHLQTDDLLTWSWVAVEVYRPWYRRMFAGGTPAGLKPLGRPSRDRAVAAAAATAQTSEDESSADNQEDMEETSLARSSEESATQCDQLQAWLHAFQQRHAGVLTKSERALLLAMRFDSRKDSRADVSLDHLQALARVLQARSTADVLAPDAAIPWLQGCAGRFELHHACLLGKYLDVQAPSEARRACTGGWDGAGDRSRTGAALPPGVCLHTLFSLQLRVCAEMAGVAEWTACPYTSWAHATLADLHVHVPAYQLLCVALGPSWPRLLYASVAGVLFARARHQVVRQDMATRLVRDFGAHVWVSRTHSDPAAGGAGGAAHRDESSVRVPQTVTLPPLPHILCFLGRQHGGAYVASAKLEVYPLQQTMRLDGEGAPHSLFDSDELCRTVMGLPEVLPTLSRAASVQFAPALPLKRRCTSVVSDVCASFRSVLQKQMHFMVHLQDKVSALWPSSPLLFPCFAADPVTVGWADPVVTFSDQSIHQVVDTVWGLCTQEASGAAVQRWYGCMCDWVAHRMHATSGIIDAQCVVRLPEPQSPSTEQLDAQVATHFERIGWLVALADGALALSPSVLLSHTLLAQAQWVGLWEAPVPSALVCPEDAFVAAWQRLLASATASLPRHELLLDGLGYLLQRLQYVARDRAESGAVPEDLWARRMEMPIWRADAVEVAMTRSQLAGACSGGAAAQPADVRLPQRVLQARVRLTAIALACELFRFGDACRVHVECSDAGDEQRCVLTWAERLPDAYLRNVIGLVRDCLHTLPAGCTAHGERSVSPSQPVHRQLARLQSSPDAALATMQRLHQRMVDESEDTRRLADGLRAGRRIEVAEWPHVYSLLLCEMRHGGGVLPITAAQCQVQLVLRDLLTTLLVTRAYRQSQAQVGGQSSPGESSSSGCGAVLGGASSGRSGWSVAESLPTLIAGDWIELIVWVQHLIHSTPHLRSRVSYCFLTPQYRCTNRLPRADVSVAPLSLSAMAPALDLPGAKLPRLASRSAAAAAAAAAAGATSADETAASAPAPLAPPAADDWRSLPLGTGLCRGDVHFHHSAAALSPAELMTFDLLLVSPAHMVAADWARLQQCSFERIVALDALAESSMRTRASECRAFVAPKSTPRKRKATVASTGAAVVNQRVPPSQRHRVRAVGSYLELLSRLNAPVRWCLVAASPSLHHQQNDALWAFLSGEPYSSSAWRSRAESAFAWHTRMPAAGLSLEATVRVTTLAAESASPLEACLARALDAIGSTSPNLDEQVRMRKQQQAVSLLVWCAHAHTELARHVDEHLNGVSVEQRALWFELIQRRVDLSTRNTHVLQHASCVAVHSPQQCAPLPCFDGSGLALPCSSDGTRLTRLSTLAGTSSKAGVLRDLLVPFLPPPLERNWWGADDALHVLLDGCDAPPRLDAPTRLLLVRFLAHCARAKHDAEVAQWIQAQHFYAHMAELHKQCKLGTESSGAVAPLVSAEEAAHTLRTHSLAALLHLQAGAPLCVQLAVRAGDDRRADSSDEAAVMRSDAGPMRGPGAQLSEGGVGDAGGSAGDGDHGVHPDDVRATPAFVRRVLSHLCAVQPHAGNDGQEQLARMAEHVRRVAPEASFTPERFATLVRLGVVCLSDEWTSQFLLRMSDPGLAALHECCPGWTSIESPQLAHLVVQARVSLTPQLAQPMVQESQKSQLLQCVYRHVPAMHDVDWVLSSRGRALCRQLVAAQWPEQRCVLARLHVPHVEEQVLLVCQDATAARLVEMRVHQLLCDNWGASQHTSTTPAYVVLDGHGLRAVSNLHLLRMLVADERSSCHDAWARVRMPLPDTDTTALVAWSCIMSDMCMVQDLAQQAQTRVIVATHSELGALMRLRLPRLRTVLLVQPCPADDVRLALRQWLARASAFQDVFVYTL